MKKKFKVLEVTFTEQYLVPMAEDTKDKPVGNLRTEINGWTIDQVIDDWFKRNDLNSSHATRYAYHVGNSKKLVDIDISDE